MLDFVRVRTKFRRRVLHQNVLRIRVKVSVFQKALCQVNQLHKNFRVKPVVSKNHRHFESKIAQLSFWGEKKSFDFAAFVYSQ